MSADNGIYILVTKDSHKYVGGGCYENCLPDGITAYRVAEAGAIDNLEYYEKNQPYNVGYYLHLVWGKSRVFYSLEEAMEYAVSLEKQITYTEYGISVIDRQQYRFPW